MYKFEGRTAAIFEGQILDKRKHYSFAFLVAWLFHMTVKYQLFLNQTKNKVR